MTSKQKTYFSSKHQDTILLGDFGLAKILQPQENCMKLQDFKLYGTRNVGLQNLVRFPHRCLGTRCVCLFHAMWIYAFDCDDDEETKDAIRNRKYLFEPSEYWVDVSSEAKDFYISMLTG